MIDWTKIEGFDWDDGNRRKSDEKHAVTAAEAEQVFLDPNVVVALDIAHSWTERRFHAFGVTLAGRPLLIAFTIRESAIRVISARPMNVKERQRYAEEGEKDSEVQK